MMMPGRVSLSILPVFLSLLWDTSSAPQLSLVPLRVSLRQHQKLDSYTIVRPYTPIRQFFPDVVLYKDFAEWNTYHAHVRQPSPPPVEKRRRVVRLETKKIPFSLLEDMRRDMFQSEAAKIIEKGSDFVHALR